jgi:transposase InsO family protein
MDSDPFIIKLLGNYIYALRESRDNKIFYVGQGMRNLYRETILDACVFMDLEEVRYLTTELIKEYNYRIPHEPLNNLTPDEW